MKKIYFFVDLSPSLGLGHFFRCLALAEEAPSFNLTPTFIADDQTYQDFFRSWDVGFATSSTIENDSFFVIDTATQINRDLLSFLQSKNSITTVIDNKTCLDFKFDFFVDALFSFEIEGKCPLAKKILAGLDFAIVRSAFSKSNNLLLRERDNYKTLVCFGGGDDLKRTTFRFLQKLDLLGYRKNVDIIAGVAFDEVKSITKGWANTEVIRSTSDMVNLMSKSNLIVTKMGVTVFESISLGIPTLLVEPTVEHVKLSKFVSEKNRNWPAISFGIDSEENLIKAAQKLIRLKEYPSELTDLKNHCSSFIDGQGASRVLREMITHGKFL